MPVHKRPKVKRKGQKQYWYIEFWEDSGKRNEKGKKIYIHHDWSIGEVGRFSKREAEAILETAKLAHGIKSKTSQFKQTKITLSSWFNEVLHHKKNVLKNKKWIDDKRSADRWIKFLGRDFNPRNLTVKIIDNFKDWRQDQKYKNKPVSGSTVNHDIAFGRSAWNLAAKWNYFPNIAHNPFSLAGMLKTEKILELPLSDYEIKTIFENLPKKERFLFIQQTSSAMRIGEIIKAKKKNLGLINGHPVLLLKRTKGRKDKIIPLGDIAASNVIEAIEDNNDTEFVFINSDNRPYVDGKRLNKAVKKICKKHGLRHITSHDFRKTWATRASYQGVNTRRISDMLGHANTKVTEDRYILFDPAKIEVANVVEYDYKRFVSAINKDKLLELVNNGS